MPRWLSNAGGRASTRKRPSILTTRSSTARCTETVERIEGKAESEDEHQWDAERYTQRSEWEAIAFRVFTEVARGHLTLAGG